MNQNQQQSPKTYTDYGYDQYCRNPLKTMTYVIPANNVANVIESIPSSMITGGFQDGSYNVGGPINPGGQTGTISIQNGVVVGITQAT